MIRDACLVVYRFQLMEILSRYTVDTSLLQHNICSLVECLLFPPFARICLRSVGLGFHESPGDAIRS